MNINQSQKDTYYKQAGDWTYDIYHSHSVWLKRALVGLGLMIFLLILSLSANLILFPLKEKVPYLYAFDHATGEITKIGDLESNKLSANWELSRYCLIHYVINRESFDIDNVDVPYQLTWSQSNDNVKKEYEDIVKSNNKQSPYQTYGKDKFVTVHVISVNQLNENTVDVKFEKKITDRTGGGEQIIPKEAIVKWEFSKANTTQKMLDRDPLGFKVIYYQVAQVNLEN